ncbi:MAG: hypothetical protein ACI814_003344, partial [Mariniblastus sp.]
NPYMRIIRQTLTLPALRAVTALLAGVLATDIATPVLSCN